MKMAHHVASRWLTGATEEEPDTKTKGPPPHWDEYLKDEWEGGKQKVPNSNTKSKNIHPNVSMSTLFKTDKAFQTDVYKKYHEWLDKGKKPKAPGKKTTPSPKNAPKELGLTRKDWEAWSNREAATQKSWSKDERKALNFYTADGYEEINGKLRGQRKSIDDKAIEAMAHLEALFSDPKRSKIKKGVVASRGEAQKGSSPQAGIRTACRFSSTESHPQVPEGQLGVCNLQNASTASSPTLWP